MSEFTQLDEHLYRNLDLLQGQVSALLDTLSRLEETGDTITQGHKKRLFQLRKKKSNVSTVSGSSSSGRNSNTVGPDRASPVMPAALSAQELADVESQPGGGGGGGSLAGMASLSNSNQSLNTLASSAGTLSGRPTSFPGGDVTLLRSALRGPPAAGDVNGASVSSSSTREEVIQQVQDMQADLSSMTQGYLRHRDQLKQLIDTEAKAGSLQQPQVAVVASLRQSLNAAMAQNAQLRTRLARIHAESDLGELPSLAAAVGTAEYSAAGGGSLVRGINNSLSYSSSCISEFFDAREYAEDSAGDTDDDVSSTDFSDTAGESGADEDEEEEDAIFMEPMATASAGTEHGGGEKVGGGGTVVLTGRRRTLPVPKTDTEGVNLWNLLCKNIGGLISSYRTYVPYLIAHRIFLFHKLLEIVGTIEYCKSKYGTTPWCV